MSARTVTCRYFHFYAIYLKVEAALKTYHLKTMLTGNIFNGQKNTQFFCLLLRILVEKECRKSPLNGILPRSLHISCFPLIFLSVLAISKKTCSRYYYIEP